MWGRNGVLLMRVAFGVYAVMLVLSNSCTAAFIGRPVKALATSQPNFCDQSKDDICRRLCFSVDDSHCLCSPLTLLMANDGNDVDDDDYDPRDNLARQVRGLQSTGLKMTIETGDTVICRREIPSLGIWEGKSYELRSIYAQKFQDQSQTMEKITLLSLDDPIPPGYNRYITLYSPLYTKGSVGNKSSPIIVTPEEVGLVSVRTEILDSVWLAIPGFFWVFVAGSFYNYYHERTGGTFFDAFWGR